MAKPKLKSKPIHKESIQQISDYLSFIVPMHNEAEGIVAFVEALDTYAKKITTHYEIILIDDGSTDNGVAIIKEKLLMPSVKLLALSRNFGKEYALTAGLKHCKGQAAIVIDADFQHPFDTIPGFIKQWQDGYDMVYGLRADRKNEGFLKRNFTRTFYRLLGMMGDVEIPRHAGDFRLIDRKVIDAINECGENSRFMKGIYAWVGFKTTSVVYEVQDRFAGKSSWSFFKLFELAITGIISFSDLPLRIWSLVGMLISSIAFLYAAWIVFKTLAFGVDIPGYATMVVAIMFFGGIQLISVGILGEYIARIFREVKKRPHYIIAEKIGFDEGE
jgi:polyisoprenyl-phosphate glycosyltransferase